MLSFIFLVWYSSCVDKKFHQCLVIWSIVDYSIFSLHFPNQLSFLTFILRSVKILSLHQLIFCWSNFPVVISKWITFISFSSQISRIYSNLHPFIYIMFVLYSDVDNMKIENILYASELMYNRYILSDNIHLMIIYT